MSNDLTLIEAIGRKQAEIISDFEQSKNKDIRYSEDIEAIQKHQAEVAAEIENLQRKSASEQALNQNAF